MKVITEAYSYIMEPNSQQSDEIDDIFNYGK